MNVLWVKRSKALAIVYGIQYLLNNTIWGKDFETKRNLNNDL